MIKDYIGWSINANKAIEVKIVNPGGISAFKFGKDRQMWMKICSLEFTKKNFKELALCLHELGVPHPLYIHTSNLGVPI